MYEGYGEYCLFCGVKHNEVILPHTHHAIYFFECGNAYDAFTDTWIDVCCSEPKYA